MKRRSRKTIPGTLSEESDQAPCEYCDAEWGTSPEHHDRSCDVWTQWWIEENGPFL